MNPLIIKITILFKKDNQSNLKMVLFMMVNGKVIFGKVMVCKYGQMAPGMKVNGSITRQKEKESSHMLTEIFIMEIGKKIKHLDMESISITMGPDIKVNGLMIISMAEVSKLG